MFTHSEPLVKVNVHCQSDDGAEGWSHNARMKKTESGPGPFGVNLRDKRKRLGLSMDKLSDITQVSKSYISSLESGSRRSPSEGLARRLAFGLECEASELWGSSQSAFEARALELLRSMPEKRREAAIAALYGLAASAQEAA